MKKLTILPLTLFLIVGCGSDPGERATSTSDNQSTRNTRDSSGNSNLCRDRGYDCTSSNNNSGNSISNGGQYGSGSTPAAYGESSFASLTASYNARSGNDVVANGQLELDQDYGFEDCKISKGSYSLTTTKSGQTGDIVHFYKNIQVRLGSNINAVLESVVAMENVQGQWVQDVRVRISTVNSNDCSYLTLSFSMPFSIP